MTSNSRRPLATTAEVAQYLGTTPGQLAQMRYAGTGPHFTLTGPRSVRYDWDDVDRWLAGRKFVRTGAEAVSANS